MNDGHFWNVGLRWNTSHMKNRLSNNTVLERRMSGHFYNWQDETSKWEMISTASH